MRPHLDCSFEPAVLRAALGGSWSDESTEDLAMHVQACSQCAEVAEVVGVLRADRETADGRARVPAAGQVWWRATVRARMEAAQMAARPITWLQGAAGASVIGVAFAVLVLAWSSLSDVAGRAVGLMTGLDPGASQAAASVLGMLKGSVPLMLGVAGVAMVAPLLVLYFALSRGD